MKTDEAMEWKCWARVLLVGLWLALILGTGCEKPTGASFPEPQAIAPQGTVYYVSPTGDNSYQGTEEAYPWQTIQKAAGALEAGDTVFIKAGTYHERVIPQNSGSDGGEITYAAYPGDVVTVDGSGIPVPTDEGLFHIADRSHIRVSGLRIVNSAYAGILVDRSGYVVIEHNYTYNTVSSGIGVWNSHHITVDGNEVVSACSSGWQESLTVAGTDTFEVKNNHVHNETHGYDKEGICVKDGSANGRVYRNHVHHVWAVGIYIDAWDKHTHHMDVFQNSAHDILDNNGFSLASETGGLLENIRIYNNVSYHNRYCGLTVSVNGPGDAQGRRPMKDVYVVNNTFYNNGWETWGGGVAVDNPDAQNVVVRNNIVSQNLYFQIAVNAAVPGSQVTIDHNLVDGYRGTEGETYGSDSVEGDPLFVDPAGADFHLQAASPAVDQGSATGAPGDDFDGAPRPQDGDGDGASVHDIGAFEIAYLAAVPSHRAIAPGGVATYTVCVGDAFSGPVTLDAGAPDPSLTVQLAPAAVIPPGHAVLTVTDTHSGSALLPGLWHTIPITATSNVVRTAGVRLLVGGAQNYLPVVLKSD